MKKAYCDICEEQVGEYRYGIMDGEYREIKFGSIHFPVVCDKCYGLIHDFILGLKKKD